MEILQQKLVDGQERAAAAEARLKRLTGNGKKKLPNPDAQPLRGPNNQPLMTWSVGN